jgi:hypothetical protein
MRLFAATLLSLIACIGLNGCAGTNTAVGITTNQDADAAQRRPR